MIIYIVNTHLIPIVEYLFENKGIIKKVFPSIRSYNFLPAFLEPIELEIKDETVTLSCRYSLKSLSLILPFISRDKRRSYGFIRYYMEMLAREIYEIESKKGKWKQTWIRIKNSMRDHDEGYDEASKTVKSDYELATKPLLESYKIALKKRTRAGRNKALDELDRKAVLLGKEHLQNLIKAEEQSRPVKIFTIKIAPATKVDIRKEIEEIAFAYDTHGISSADFRKNYSGAAGKEKKQQRIRNIIDSLIVEKIITPEGLPTGKILTLDDLRSHLSRRIGRDIWQDCAYCGVSFYKIFERGRTKRKYCDKPSCRTLAYRKRKKEGLKD